MTDNFRASLLMILTMAGFASEDLIIKLLIDRVPIGEIMMLLGIGGITVMFIAARIGGARILDPLLLAPASLIRLACELGTQVFGYAGLALLPLSTVTAVNQAAPIAATLAAGLFLGEVVGWRRWSAVGVGVIGMLMIVQPGSTAFEPALILPLLAMICVAVRDLATRRVPVGLSVLQLNFWGYATTLPGGIILALATRDRLVMPAAIDWLVIVVTLAIGVAFYWTLTLALRLGESSVVVPFRYMRLAFVLVLAAVFLGERPEALMLAGTALVTLAGLYTLWREARLRTRRRIGAAG